MTGALVGVAVAAKAAADFTAFQSTMTRTVTLAGATEEEMQAASKEILAVSTELGKGPQELAEALYFTQSAGIDASRAMEVVEASAKASAVGLGETQVVADALTSVINAYGAENIDAARAADILTAAVREGKGEADAIAGAIGRVIPVASEMGVGFEEVAAGIAAMTRTGLDANEAVTALRGALTAMLNPTVEARDLLTSVGLSAEGLRAMIADRGLLSTLQELQVRFEGNDEAFGQLFGNVRAQAGVLSLLGSNASEVGEVFRDVAASGGTLEEAFRRVQETSEFKLQQAFSAVQTALVEIGGAIAPVVKALADVLTVVSPLLKPLALLAAAIVALKVFTAVRGWVGTALQAFRIFGGAVVDLVASTYRAEGALAALKAAFAALGATGIGSTIAALGRFTFVGGGFAVAITAIGGAIADLTRDLDALSKQTGAPVEFLEAATNRLSLISNVFSSRSRGFRFDDVIGGLNGVGAEIAALADDAAALAPILTGLGLNSNQAWKVLQDNIEVAGGNTEVFSENVRGNIAYLRSQTEQLTQGSITTEEFTRRMEVFGLNANAAGRLAAEGAREADQALIKAARSAEQTDAAMRRWTDFMRTSRPTLTSFADAVGTTSDQITAGMQKAAREGTAATEAFIRDTLAGLKDWRAEAADSLTGIGGVLSDLAGDARLTATEVHKAFTQAAKDTRAFTKDLVEISKSGGQAGKDLANALLEMGPSAAGLADVVAGAGDDMRNQLIEDFGAITGAGQDGARKLQDALVGPLKDIRDILQAIAKHFGVNVTLNDHGARSKLAGIQSGLQQLPDRKVIEVLVITRNQREGYSTVHTGGLIMHDGGGVLETAKRFHVGDLASDEVPAILQRGEYVIRRSAVQEIGVGALDAINRLHVGGPVHETAPARPATLAVSTSAERQKIRVELDRRRFGRALDFDEIVDGYWS